MKNNIEENEKKNRKKLLLVAGISLFTVLGGTLAYFTTSTTLENKFKVGKYEARIVEEFVSPSNWLPGTTTNKTVKITNDGTIDMALRASYKEKWVNANGKELALMDSSNNVAAIINLDSSWSKADDGYYYYGTKNNKTKLTPGQTTSSFIKSVKFNEKISASLTKTTSSDGKTITYTSSGNGYDNATYTLTITIDTIQYDQANNIW